MARPTGRVIDPAALVVVSLFCAAIAMLSACGGRKEATADFAYVGPGQLPGGSTHSPPPAAAAPDIFLLRPHAPTVPARNGNITFVVRALDANSQGIAGEPVTFSVVRGQASLTPTAGITDGNGLLSTVVASGAPGIVGVRADIGALHRVAAVTFVRTCNGNVTFAAPVAIDMNIVGLANIAVGDLNGDAAADLVLAGDNNQVTPMIGDGNGHFSQKPSVRNGDISMDGLTRRLLDVTNDGLADVVTSYYAHDSIGIWEGDGTGGFSNWSNLNYDNDQLVAVGDLDGDGLVDVAASGYYGARETVAYGVGQGAFTRETLYDLAGGRDGFGAWTALGDFNKDGVLDIVVGNDNSTTNITVLNSGGPRQYTTAQNVVTAPRASYVATADVNNDTVSDLLVTSDAYSGMYVIPGRGDGTFANSVLYNTNAYGAVPLAEDLNGDGWVDIVAGSNSISADVYINRGNGTFPTASALVTTNATSNNIALADFNGDGRIDIVAQDANGISLTLNTCQ